jgi:hypothetical protein
MDGFLPPYGRIAPLVALVCLMATAAGCGGLTASDEYDPYGRLRERRNPAETAVRVRAQDALHCAEIAERYVGAGGWVATGCGLEQSYTCARYVTGVAYYGYGHLGGGVRTQSATTCAPDGEPHAIVSSGETGQRVVPLR